MKKIFLVAPIKSIGEIAQKVSEERAHELSCSIRIANTYGVLDSIPAIAQEAQEWGADVIISRGGTSVLISEFVDIPVVSIQVTALDILEALRKVRPHSGRIGIAGVKNVIYEYESLNEYLATSLEEIVLHNRTGDLDLLAAAAQRGIGTVVGDTTAVRLAASLGLDGIIINSGKAAVYKAIKEAESVIDVRRKEQERAELLRSIIDMSTDGIMVVDKQARITLLNPVAEDIFRINSNLAAGRPVYEVIPNSRLHIVVNTAKAEVGEIQYVADRVLATKRIPIKVGDEVVGAVANFQDVTQLQCFEQTVRQKLLDKGFTAKRNIDDIIGKSEVMLKAKEQARRYASNSSTILITGETGTGKEMFAQSIHNLSDRSRGPFVAINCAALPESLLESEMLGYEEGAFTGAKKGGKQGMFELAHKGTIFLDEVGEMSLLLQARFLRVLQEKEVMRLGGHKIIPVDVRIIVATNQNLFQLVEKKKFRADLYYRLDVLRLNIPPLRQRSEDIPLFIRHFFHKFAYLNKKVTDIAPAAVKALTACKWQGNVRELINVIERLVLLADGAVIGERDIAEVANGAAGAAGMAAPAMGMPADVPAGPADMKYMHTGQDMWQMVFRFHGQGMGPRKIAKEMQRLGYDIKYYNIAYRLKGLKC